MSAPNSEGCEVYETNEILWNTRLENKRVSLLKLIEKKKITDFKI